MSTNIVDVSKVFWVNLSLVTELKHETNIKYKGSLVLNIQK